MLSLFRLNQYDGGFCIDKACVVTRDLDDADDFGKQNVGIYRLQVKGKNRLGIQPVPVHDAGLHLRMAEERGENLPVAIWWRSTPCTRMACGPPGTDRWERVLSDLLGGRPR